MSGKLEIDLKPAVFPRTANSATLKGVFKVKAVDFLSFSQ